MDIIDKIKKECLIRRTTEKGEEVLMGLEDEVLRRLVQKESSSRRQRFWWMGVAAVSLMGIWVGGRVLSRAGSVSVADLKVEQRAYYYLESEDISEGDMMGGEEWMDTLSMEDVVELLDGDGAEEEIFDYLYKNLSL